MEEEMASVMATENYGSIESWKYHTKDGVMERRREGCEGGSRRNTVAGVLKSIFLPQGYPESVSSDYMHYQLWDTMQAFCSALSGTLATQATFKGVGVGDTEATVAAATVTWLLKDGAGMLGRILFAWQKGTKLDSEAKTWRLFADILNDIAMFMIIMAPQFPAFFTLTLCAAGILKSIVGVAGGATRAALTVHQARRDNMADVSAKDGSQETLVNLTGLLVSFVFIPFITDNPILTLSLFFVFAALHIFANYKAVRAIVMETFSEARLSIVMQQFLTDHQILSPKEANRKEPVFLSFWKTVPIKLGVRLDEIVRSPEELDLALTNNNMPFLVGIRNGCIRICLQPGASVSDEIRAMCQAVVLSNKLSALPSKVPLTGQQKRHWEMIHESHKLMDTIFDPFLKGVKAAGWDMRRTLLDWDEWRVEWKTKSR